MNTSTLVNYAPSFFDLGLDYDNLAGATKSDKIVSLLQLLDRQGKIGELKQKVYTDSKLSYLKNAYLDETLQLRQREKADFDPDAAPYRGMDVFEEHHAPIFFGREGLSSELVQRDPVYGWSKWAAQLSCHYRSEW